MSDFPDPRLVRVAAGVPAPGDLVWMAEMLFSGRLRVVDDVSQMGRKERLDARDAAIREARALIGGNLTVGAKEIAAALEAFTGGPAAYDGGSDAAPGAGAWSAAIHNIARLNRGRPLCWRQIWSILDGVRCS